MAHETLTFGFVPLIDCAIPAVAQEMGFAEQEGIRLRLVREASWAATRDKLAVGVLDAAHLLAGLPIAADLGVGGGPAAALIVPMALGQGGNAITVSTTLLRRMMEADPDAMAGARAHTARALKAVIVADRAAGRPMLSFASVFPVSTHNYELRYWLAAAGIDPDRDVNMGVVAPPRMSESLRLGWIDGYCAGEPWNLRTVQKGHGAIVATKGDIWPNAPEKVVGIRTAWADRNPDALIAALRALLRAAMWADEPGNRGELAALLADPRYLGVPADLLRSSLDGRPVLRPGAEPTEMPDRHVFFRRQATFPWRSHAVWLMTQMARWGQVRPDIDMAATAGRVYRPDLYRAAAASLGLAAPAEDYRVEGLHDAPHRETLGGAVLELGPDRFLDGRRFDPADPAGYLRGFEIGRAFSRARPA